MKTLFFILLTFPAISYAQQNYDPMEELIELPIEFVHGYGPFETIRSFKVHTWKEPDLDSPWGKTALKVSGLPEHWINIKKENNWFDAHQFVYQNYKAGNIDENHFNTLIQQWNIDFSKREYSDQPIQCFVYLIMGKNKDGEVRYKIDTDNDLDFSDEEEKIPILFDSAKRYFIPKLALEAEKVTYETIVNGQVEKTEIPVLVMQFENDWLMSNFPQHAKTMFKNKEIRICSNNFCSTSYDNSSITLMTSDEPEIINEDEVFVIDGEMYKNLGVNISSRILTLQRMQKDVDLYLPQVGYKAPSFSGEEFTSGEPIASEDFSGKFLYVEFWGSWCAPCIKELPYLKEAYHQLDSSKINFLGIAYNDNPERLRKLMEKEGIKWPQMLTQEADGIVDEYDITGYPASFLIDPEGKIIAKDLRGKRLTSDILKHMNNWPETNMR